MGSGLLSLVPPRYPVAGSGAGPTGCLAGGEAAGCQNSELRINVQGSREPDPQHGRRRRMASGVPGAAGRWLWAGAKKLAQSKAADRAATAAATGFAKQLPSFTTDRFGKRRASRQQRALAEGLARQVGGKVSYRTVIDYAERFVVWSDGKPLAAFPPPEDEKPLEERPELQNFNQALLVDPPPRRGGR